MHMLWGYTRCESRTAESSMLRVWKKCPHIKKLLSFFVLFCFFFCGFIHEAVETLENFFPTEAELNAQCQHRRQPMCKLCARTAMWSHFIKQWMPRGPGAESMSKPGLLTEVRYIGANQYKFTIALLQMCTRGGNTTITLRSKAPSIVLVLMYWNHDCLCTWPVLLIYRLSDQYILSCP